MISYDQKNRIGRIYSQPIYLIDNVHEKNHFVFQISGSTANLYTVEINGESNKLSEALICSCPDMKSWALTAGVKCKHCCFVLIKVLGLSAEILEVNKFQEFGGIKKIVETCQNLVIRKELINETYRLKYQKLKNNGELLKKKDDKRKFSVTKELEDKEECPICFDDLKIKNSAQCPVCHNLVHLKCIKKWISMGNKSCVYCRGDWSDFGTSKTINKYINLVS